MNTNEIQIHFKFREGTTPQDVQSVLSEVRHIQGVFNTYALFEDHANFALGSMYVAQVKDVNSPENIAGEIIKVSNKIEYAHVPSQRRTLEA